MLDNCEQVIEAAAGLAAAFLSGTPGVNILTTSREPLGVQGERVYRLGPLSRPERSPGLTATEAAAFPAVQLFVERVTAIVEDFALTDTNAPLVVEICRRLDGLPLAIEFAAPRVEVLRIGGLAARLDDSLRQLLGAQRRAAVPRHRTMRAVVDWSYGLLSEDEQRVLRALGIFAGGFTGEAAAAVVTDAATAVALAPGFRRPGVAHRAERHWRRGGARRPGHVVLRPMPRRLPGRAVGGKSSRGRTLRGNAARSFEKARLCGLE
jgi:predicted ATPase